MILQSCAGVIFSIIAAMQDYKEYKIKNKLVLVFIAVGLIINLFRGGLPGLLGSLIGMIIPIILFPLFALNMLGAGDIKAFMALGAIFGYKNIVMVMCFSFIAGGIIGILLIAVRKNGFQRIKKLGEYLKVTFLSKSLMKYDGLKEKDAVFRFAYAIAIGCLCFAIYINK